MGAFDGHQSTDGTIRPLSRAYVVYDRRTGKVLHVHHSITFPGTKPQGEAPEVRARRLAGNQGATAAVIEVDPNEVSDGKPFKVDVAKQRIVRKSASTKRAPKGKKSASGRKKPKRAKSH